eukprot:4385208-Alexandrium_andersonii.AAC.1
MRSRASLAAPCWQGMHGARAFRCCSSARLAAGRVLRSTPQCAWSRRRSSEVQPIPTGLQSPQGSIYRDGEGVPAGCGPSCCSVAMSSRR